MYITISSLKKTLGKYFEMTDLYISLPIIFIFLTMFSFTDFKLESLVFLTVSIFLMLPINLSKKNRMYKIIFLLFRYLLKIKEYIYLEEN